MEKDLGIMVDEQLTFQNHINEKINPFSAKSLLPRFVGFAGDAKLSLQYRVRFEFPAPPHVPILSYLLSR